MTSESEHPPGTVLIPIVRAFAYVEFMMSVLALDVPKDTEVWAIRSMDVTATLNEGIRNMEGEWIWFQADDHHFPPNTLMRLLDHNVDVVVPLMNRKSPPFDLVAYKEEVTVVGRDGREYPGYKKFDIDELPGEGLFPVYAAGTGSMLVRKHVLDAVGDPWFHNPQQTVINDDLEFCRKLRDAGFQILVDPTTSVGHVSHFTSYYAYEPVHRKWGLSFDFGGPGTNRVWLTKDAIQSFEASRQEVPDDGPDVA